MHPRTPDPAGAEPDDWERHLSAPVLGQKVIVAFELLAGMRRTVDHLRRWGAQRPLLISEGVGTGSVPTEEDGDIVRLPSVSFGSMTEQVRGRMDPEALLTPEALAAVHAYDPGRSASFWVSPVGPNTPILGRRVLGGRPPHQIALEDKSVVDELLGAVGAPRSPAMLARTSYDSLMEATNQVLQRAQVDQVVWAGDASRGVNGGGDYVRWVRSNEQAREFAAFFASRCEQVRVSPFLEGVPCSIHGVVLPDGVAVFRPLEIVSLRDPDRGTFVYAGLGTTWEPPISDTDQMRELARAVGEHLRREHSYLGAFGLDGVLSRHGFRVTELNSRLSGGLTRIGRSTPELHLELVQMNALIGRNIGMSTADYESLALQGWDDNRFVDVLSVATGLETRETYDVPVTAGDGRLELADLDDAVIGTITRGQSPMGTFLRLALVEGSMGEGERAAPLGVLLHEFANRVWDAGLGNCLMPSDVRQ